MATKFTTVRVRGIRPVTAGHLDIADTREWLEVMCWGQTVAAIRMSDQTVKRMPGYGEMFSNESILQAAEGAAAVMRDARKAGVYS
jgi:hypothetical protein